MGEEQIHAHKVCRQSYHDLFQTVFLTGEASFIGVGPKKIYSIDRRRQIIRQNLNMKRLEGRETKIMQVFVLL